jgi:glycerol-3-phosphate dehydrogenase (NAD(P)+)
MHLAIVGAGSWGTALAIALAPRFPSVRLWVRDSAQAADILLHRENNRYLPGFRLPETVEVSPDLDWVMEDACIVLSAVPSAYLRGVVESMRRSLTRNALLVSASKGIEEDSLCRMSEVIGAVLGPALTRSVAVLSGPTFAREIAAGEPAAVVIASHDAEVAREIQQAFSTARLRFYTSGDVIGVEIGAALKNVIAIGAGVCRGLGLGSNSVAALVTRGLAEITRLAVTLGGSSRTLSGLAGLGDLVLTATGDLSRNRFVGIQLGQGHKLEHILANMAMIAEGVATCRAAYQLGVAHRIDLPIVNKMYQILYQAKDPQQAIRELMERPLTSE